MPKRVAVLGSTGSIGRQTLDVIEALPAEFEVIGLAAGRNLELFAQQVARWQPRMISTAVPIDGDGAPPQLRSSDAAVVTMEEMAAAPEVEVVVVATTGRAGLAPTLAAVRAGKTVALANKEALVMAGALLAAERAKTRGKIYPVDSEHSAIWQCLLGEERCSCDTNGPALVGLCDVTPAVHRIILTASGGAFRDYTLEQLRTVTPAEALRHPNWSMGARITVDSATMVNKGLEVIEAHWLFGVPLDRIEVVIHRESVVHSLVEFVDGALKAQLSEPDMRLPIQHALTHPVRHPGLVKRLDLAAVGRLTFEAVDMKRYPGLALSLEAAKQGMTYPAVLAASDEQAVELFIKGKIGFTDIVTLADRALQAHVPVGNPSLDDVLLADEWARRKCVELAGA